MSEVAHLAAVGAVALAIGYFIPRSRDVMNRIDTTAEAALDAMPADASQPVFDELFAVLPVAVMLLDPQGAIARMNAAASQLFGRTGAQSLGRAVIEATGSFELDRLVAEAQENGEAAGTVEYHAAPTPATLRVFVKVLADRSVLYVASDESAAVDAERVRREFLGNISHELRTPLAGSKLMIETLNTDDDPQTLAYFLPRLEREIDRMVELVEHLLTVARSESGRIDLQIRSVALDTIAEEALELLEHRMHERGLTLARDLQPVVVDADGARLAQVVLNFVENAMRHTPGGGTVTVRTFIENATAVIEVSDTGSGIPFKDLPHLFERFYVVDRSRAKDRGGLGVGLAIVKRNVEAHGGTVGAVSEFGSGSTFRASIPITAKAYSVQDSTVV